MRSLISATTVILALAACSADGIPTQSEDVLPPSEQRTALFAGERFCEVGLVQAGLELFGGRLNGTTVQPARAVLRVSIDGALHSQTAAPRIRVDGTEIRLGSPLTGDDLEVFVGLGRDCSWIHAVRVQ